MKLKYFIKFIEQFYFNCNVVNDTLIISDKLDGKEVFTYPLTGDVIDLFDFIACLLVINSLTK